MVTSISKEQINALFLILDVGLMIENSAVFQAQVVDQVLALKKLDYSVVVLCAFSDREKFQLAAGNKLNEYKVPVILISDRGLLINIIAFTSELIKLTQSRAVRQIYIRGFWAAFPILLASPMRRISYVYDVRGDTIDESVARGRAPHRLCLIQMLETFALQRARYVTCVSIRLSSIIQSRARLECLPDVIPSCIDLTDFLFSEEVRTVRRSELGYSDEDIVLVYSGGMAAYQMLAEMIVLWRSVLRLNNNIKFLLMINSDPQSLKCSLGSLDKFGSRIKILNLPRSKVFETLSAADIGFLLREDRALNATASPVKFAEYLAAGLAVVSSPGVGDISDRITNRNIGVLVKPLRESPEVTTLTKFIDEFNTNRVAFRNRSLLVVRENYGWLAYENIYHKMYSNIV